MKRVIMYIIVFVLGIVLGGLGVHFVSEYQTDKAEDKYESSYRDSRAASLKQNQNFGSSQSNNTESSQVVSLPSQEEVTKRVSNDLDKFIAEQKDGLLKTVSVEDSVDAFEDSYLDTYEDELQTKYPGDANEDQIEHLLDTAVATLNIHQKISDNK
jgi:hypothetical protein